MSVYISCEDFDFVWKEKDVVEFDRMWNEGLSVKDIAKSFNRGMIDTALLVLDRAEKGYIEPRQGGISGRRMPG